MHAYINEIPKRHLLASFGRYAIARKWARQYAKVVGKANRTLGLIKRCFGHLTEDVFLKLYKSLVRPKLEYAMQA
jgi:hypothetical protein